MAEFIYKAKQTPQKTVNGEIEAANLDAAVAKLARLGIMPLDVRKKKSGTAAREENRSWIPRLSSSRIPLAEIVFFSRQMGDLLAAGVPVLPALAIIRKQTRHAAFRQILDKIYAAVEDGKMLSASLGKFPDVFPPMVVNVVLSGESVGHLALVFGRLADFLEKDQETRAQIKSSLIYPGLILGVGLITIFVLLTWVIPRITVLFDDMNQTLPLATRILLGLSSFLSRFWWVMAGAGIFLVYAFKNLQTHPTGRLWLDDKKLKIPGLGDFIHDEEIARFARTLGTLLENGVVVVPALESVQAVMGNEVFKQAAEKITRDVTQGVGLAEAVKASGVFPESAMNMIAVSEHSGQMHKGLYRLADYHERQAQRFTKTVTSLVEPLLILCLGSVLGFVVLAMLMPIFQMNMIIK